MGYPSDLYSLGVLICHLTNGIQPFQEYQEEYLSRSNSHEDLSSAQFVQNNNKNNKFISKSTSLYQVIASHENQNKVDKTEKTDPSKIFQVLNNKPKTPVNLRLYLEKSMAIARAKTKAKTKNDDNSNFCKPFIFDISTINQLRKNYRYNYGEFVPESISLRSFPEGFHQMVSEMLNFYEAERPKVCQLLVSCMSNKTQNEKNRYNLTEFNVEMMQYIQLNMRDLLSPVEPVFLI